MSTTDDSKPIELWGKLAFVRLQRDLDAVFGKLDEAAGLVADLQRLAGPENRERIADWAMQCKVDFEISLPGGFGWPGTPALDALRAARSDFAKEEALAA